MRDKRQITLLQYFSGIKDPRINRKKLYPLTKIFLIVLCGTNSNRSDMYSKRMSNCR